jgi:hypothetical protein
VVGVQMRVDDVRDVLGVRARLRELAVDPSDNVVRRAPEVPDAGVDQCQHGRRPQQERVDVPPPVALSLERPRVPLAFAVPVDVAAGRLVGERQRRPPVAQRDDLDVSDADGVRHAASVPRLSRRVRGSSTS